MAVPTFTIYNGTSASTSHTIPLPAGRAGARVFIFLGPLFGGTFNQNGSVWTTLSLFAGIGGGVYYRDCDGSEANPTMTVGTASQFRAMTAMIANAGFARGAAPVFASASGLDPAAVATNVGNGTLIAACQWNHTTTCNLTSNPSTYTAGVSGNATANIPGASVCYRNVAPAAASENPGVFALSVAPTGSTSFTIYQAGTITPTLHTNTPQIGGDDGVTNFTPPTLDASCFTFGQSPIAGTSHNIPLPTDLNGKRLIVAFTGLGTAAASIVFPAGWLEIDTTSNANERQEIFYRDCDGSEGSTLAITTATSILASWGMVAFPKGSYDRAQAPVGSATTSSSTLTPNPGSVNSGAGLGFSRGAYWLSSLGQRGVASPPTITAAPAGFTLRGSSVGPNVYGTAWADKVDNVQTLDPGTWTTTGTATNQSASTIAVKAAWPVAALLFTTPATPYPAPFYQNTQTFYGPKINLKYTAAFHQNTQSFPTQKIVRRPSAPFYQNPQVFYGPKLRMTVKLAALHQNAQAFYAPAIISAPPPAVLVPPRHNNAQEFYSVTLSFHVHLTAPLHQNTQEFYGPTLYRLQKLVAPFHQNAQEFYDHAITRAGKVVPPFHQNVQVFYGPTIKAPRFLTPTRHDNAQVFYGPTLRFGILKVAPFHQNVQSFFGPTLRMTLKVAARFDNAQAFYGPTIVRVLKPTLHTNLQQFYGPTLRVGARLYPPLHENQQAFYGPTLKIPLILRPSFHQNRQTFYLPYINMRIPLPPDGGVSTIGPGWWSKGIKQGRRPTRAEVRAKNEWFIPTAAEIPTVPVQSYVVQPDLLRALVLKRERMLTDLKNASKKHAMRERVIEDKIINTIMRVLIEDK